MNIEKSMPPMLSGDALIQALECYPEYDPSIKEAEPFERLEQLTDIYKVYLPFPMAVEIYHKLYLATAMSLKKKNTRLAVEQHNDTYRAMMNDKQYHGIIGGSDSLTIIGSSGIGKTSAIQRALNLISDGRVIEIGEPYTKIIPCLQVQCPYDASPKGLLLSILRSVDEVLDTKYYERSRKSSDTTDVLIGTVSQVALNHIGLLGLDEIQNVYGRKNGTSLITMLIQLVNCSGISIAMVGTEECIPFFEQAVQIARRGSGLKYGGLPYDNYFEDFCKSLWQYQYTKEAVEIDAGILEWLYEHSGGVVANIVTLIHDAQEIAILEERDKLDLLALNTAYMNRMSFLHKFINPQGNKVLAKRKKTERTFAEVDIDDEYQTMEELVSAAKERGVDPIEQLKKTICIEEVVAG